MVLLDNMIRLSHSKLAEFIFKTVTFIQCTPSYFKLWNPSIISNVIFSDSSTLKYLLLGGESFPLIDEVKLYQNWESVKRKRIFNIYGITEVSCWSTIHEITLNTDIHIGHPLDDTTILQIRDLETGAPCDSGVGELWIGGTKRICLIDNESESIMDSMDIVYRATGDIFNKTQDNKFVYKGRSNQVIKNLGLKVNLFHIENVALKLKWIIQAHCIFVDSNLILFYVRNNDNDETESDLRTFLKENLSKHEYPFYVIKLNEFPLTEHGKISKKKLEEVYRSKPTHKESIVEYFLSQLYEITGIKIEYLPEETCLIPKKTKKFNNSSFYHLGGSSVLAIQIFHAIEYEYRIACPKLVEMLINSYIPINDICHYLTLCNFRVKQITMNPIESKFKLEIESQFFLRKCIDANLSTTIIKNQKIISVGSHAHLILNIDATNNEIISQLELPDRIESEISFYENFGIVGCYDGYLYCFDVMTGIIKWKFNSGGIIKCKAEVLVKHNKIIFGNYNPLYNVWCVNLAGEFVWNSDFGMKSIIASPCLINDKQIFIANLNGDCGAFMLNSGHLKSETNVGSPIFTSPKYISENNAFLVCSVDGSINLLRQNSSKVNFKKLNLYLYEKFYHLFISDYLNYSSRKYIFILRSS